MLSPWRFIPTPVGNTSACPPKGHAVAVHPHACGEHQTIEPSNRPLPGSSPRLWGTPWRKAQGRHLKRFIPTPVGNTSHPVQRNAYLTVHPHACGEHRVDAFGARICIGSSPRLWGTLPARSGLDGAYRFIPAPVGNTYDGAETDSSPAVHPHACGEHLAGMLGDDIEVGSSPRLWGTR